MAAPEPWSYSRLSTFKNCPDRFHSEVVLKKFPYVEGPEQKKGKVIHKAFEDRQALKKPLPPSLEGHETHMQRLENAPGQAFVEQRIGLRRRKTDDGKFVIEPCPFFGDTDVWYRGQIDFMKVDGDEAFIEDYKTGNKKVDFAQLKTFALWAFVNYPALQGCTVQFYWTEDKSTNRERYERSQVPSLWTEFLPDLKQYIEAFKTDTWQKRQSGLCGWCPDTKCPHWFDGPALKAKRNR